MKQVLRSKSEMYAFKVYLHREDADAEAELIRGLSWLARVRTTEEDTEWPIHTIWTNVPVLLRGEVSRKLAQEKKKGERNGTVETGAQGADHCGGGATDRTGGRTTVVETGQ